MVEKSQINRQQKLTKPMKACTSVQFSGVGHLQTLATLTGSISTLFSEMTSPRYSIRLQWNSHFSRWRNNLCSASISKTLQTACSCFSSVFVKITMSSKYTTTIPSAMRVLKMSFIIVWKVAGLLVIPKNITRGSKRPRLVQKAAFHLSPGLMCILLKPQQTSSFVKYRAPRSWETISQKVTYLFCDELDIVSKELRSRVRQATKDVVKSEV